MVSRLPATRAAADDQDGILGASSLLESEHETVEYEVKDESPHLLNVDQNITGEHV